MENLVTKLPWIFLSSFTKKCLNCYHLELDVWLTMFDLFLCFWNAKSTFTAYEWSTDLCVSYVNCHSRMNQKWAWEKFRSFIKVWDLFFRLKFVQFQSIDIMNRSALIRIRYLSHIWSTSVILGIERVKAAVTTVTTDESLGETDFDCEDRMNKVVFQAVQLDSDGLSGLFALIGKHM